MGLQSRFLLNDAAARLRSCSIWIRGHQTPRTMAGKNSGGAYVPSAGIVANEE